MKNKKRNIALALMIITILLIIIGTICFYFIKNSQKSIQPISINETAKWQTYQDDKYQFQFKYPDNLILEKGNDMIVQKTRVQYL